MKVAKLPTEGPKGEHLAKDTDTEEAGEVDGSSFAALMSIL